MFIKLPCFPKGHCHAFRLLWIFLFNRVFLYRLSFSQAVCFLLLLVTLNLPLYLIPLKVILDGDIQILLVQLHRFELLGVLQYDGVFIS